MNEIERFEVDGLTVSVHDDTSSMAEAAANNAAALMRQAVADRGVAHVMFATGNSQLAFVERLVTQTPDVPWINTVIFHMDEYVGVGPNHPAGFQRWIRTNIVERTRPKMVHYVDGLADPATECARYSGLLDEFPLDLCCLGIGENGHLAFNDPPVADFSDPCDLKVVALDEASRRQQVNEGHFRTVADVPVDAITVTIPALLARHCRTCHRAGKPQGQPGPSHPHRNYQPVVSCHCSAPGPQRHALPGPQFRRAHPKNQGLNRIADPPSRRGRQPK